MKELKTAEFENAVINSSKPVVVDFWAPWCGPCRMMMPVMEEVEAELSDEFDFYKVCVDDEGELAEKCGIVTIPAIVLFKNGEIANKSVGGVPKEKIIAMLKK